MEVLLLISSMQHITLAMPFKKCANQWFVDLSTYCELFNVETYFTILFIISMFSLILHYCSVY